METENPQDTEPVYDALKTESIPDTPSQDGKPHRKWYQRKNTFQKGNKAYRGGSSKRVKKSPLYRDYEYVWTHQNGPFNTAGRKQLKQYLEEDRKGFLQQFGRLEQLHIAKTEKVSDPLSAGGKDAPSYDEGTQRCLELIERLLKTRGWEKNASHQSSNLELDDDCKPSGAG